MLRNASYVQSCNSCSVHHVRSLCLHRKRSHARVHCDHEKGGVYRMTVLNRLEKLEMRRPSMFFAIPWRAPTGNEIKKRSECRAGKVLD